VGKDNDEEHGSLNLKNYNDFYNHPLKTMKLFIPLPCEQNSPHECHHTIPRMNMDEF